MSLPEGYTIREAGYSGRKGWMAHDPEGNHCRVVCKTQERAEEAARCHAEAEAVRGIKGDTFAELLEVFRGRVTPKHLTYRVLDGEFCTGRVHGAVCLWHERSTL